MNININIVLLYGRLTRDPELKAIPSGTNVASFSIATNRAYKDRNGEKKEEATFHDIVAFGRQADSIAQYLKTGDGVFVEGHIKTRSWEKDGEKKFRMEIVAERVQFGPKSPGSADKTTGVVSDPDAGSEIAF